MLDSIFFENKLAVTVVVLVYEQLFWHMVVLFEQKMLCVV